MHAPKADLPLSDLPAAAADLLARVRTKHPRVHCLTNAVAQAFTANTLLAVGASPSMTVAPEEIGEFVARADALLINLGTFDRERRAAAEIAIAKAAEVGRPWLLDPVFVDRSAPRTAFAKALLAQRPAVVRLNGKEFAALAGTAPEGDAIHRFAREAGTVIALTGAIDRISDGARSIEVHNGHPLMARVTAMGCAASAVVSTCLAVEPDAWLATVGGLLAFGVAGELAGTRARGPGSFAVEIIDALNALDRPALIERAAARSEH